jgi:hypothetical protein
MGFIQYYLSHVLVFIQIWFGLHTEQHFIHLQSLGIFFKEKTKGGS